MKSAKIIVKGSRNLQMEVDEMFLSIRQLKKNMYYEHQQRMLRELLARANSLLQAWENPQLRSMVFTLSVDPDNFATDRSTSFYLKLVKKKRLIDHLLVVAENLQTHWREEVENSYAGYAKELNKLLDPTDLELINGVPLKVVVIGYEERNEFRSLSNRLRALLYKGTAGIRRDLRILLRRTTKFFLLGLDDESDAAVFGIAPDASKFIHHSTHVNGKVRNPEPVSVH